MSTFIPVDTLMDASSSSQDSIKSSGSNQANKNRKSSLSAVIDKLKSARHVNDESPPNTPTLPTPSIGGSDVNSVSSTSTGQTSGKEKVTSSNTQSQNVSNGKLTNFFQTFGIVNSIKQFSILQLQQQRQLRQKIIANTWLNKVLTA